MVLSPEHPLVPVLTSPDRRRQVEAYQAKAAKMDLVARQKTDKTKTGVFTGAYCENPATGQPDSRVDRRLRAHRIRYGRHHGGART